MRKARNQQLLAELEDQLATDLLGFHRGTPSLIGEGAMVISLVSFDHAATFSEENHAPESLYNDWISSMVQNVNIPKLTNIIQVGLETPESSPKKAGLG